MRYRNCFWIICILWLGNPETFAQTGRIDALQHSLVNTADPSEKLNLLIRLCDEGESLTADSLLLYAQHARRTAGTLRKPLVESMAAYYEAYAYYRKNIPDSVSAISGHYLTLMQRKDPNAPAINLFQLLDARSLVRKQQYKEALALYYRVLNEAEKKKDTLNQARAMAGVGSVLNRTADVTGALSWFLKGIQLAGNSPYRKQLVYLYTNTAVMYNRIDKYDSSLYFVQKAIALAREAENLTDLGNALGMYAAQLMDANGKDMDLKKYAVAEKPLREALTVSEKMGDANEILSHMGALGIFYYDINQPQKGIEICQRAIRLIDQNKLPSKLPYIYDILAKNLQLAGRYKEQAEILQQLSMIKDSVYEQNSAQAMSELKTKYEVQKKENTIIRQQLDLVKKDYLLYSSILFILLAAVISFWAFRNYRRKQKMKAAMAVTAAEETERKRIAADLHDNLGAYAASIASNVNRLSDHFKNSAEAGILNEVRNNSHAIVADLSDTIWALKKTVLPLTAVSDRLKIFIQRILSGYPSLSIDVVENIQTDHLLSPSEGFHLFQTLQEAINNAVKHSGCNHILISIEGKEKEWTVQITDNGTGMKPLSANSGGGNGLFNMKNRAEQGGWNINWADHLPHGTIVTIHHPPG